MRRLVIFCHYDKDNLIDDYVVLYLKDLVNVANTIHFVSHSALSPAELRKIEPYVNAVTLRQNVGLDFGAWQEIILTLGLNYIASHYDELILANDSCYAPFTLFSQLFNTMSAQQCDMWGMTENQAPQQTGEAGELVSIMPHIQSYFLVFRKAILQAQCFYRFWQDVVPLATRDAIIIHYEVGLTKLLREHGFICIPAIPLHADDLEKIRKEFNYQHYDFSLFYWHELLQHHNPLLKVKAIPTTLIYNEKVGQKLTQEFEKKYAAENDLCSFRIVDKHLQRTSPDYVFSKITRTKKIILLVQYLFCRSPKNNYAAVTIKKYTIKIKKKYSEQGVNALILAICKKIKKIFVNYF